MDMPPKEPLIYRLYEIVQNYGYAYKAVLNEKFGDGIMSAISFSTKVEKETDEKGDWAVITLRGKWYDTVVKYVIELTPSAGCRILDSRYLISSCKTYQNHFMNTNIKTIKGFSAIARELLPIGCRK
jgi:hypothetical protein